MTKRVLIIDDERDIRDVVRVSLEEFAGWKVLTAESGLEGLQMALAEALDAILLDISMPGMDGFQICRELQNHAITRAIPIVMLTAKVLPSEQQHLRELSVAGFISKPFDPMIIWLQLAEILNWPI
jgi:CheY-like chemotaxis protein